MNISTLNTFFYWIYQVLVYMTAFLKLVRCNTCPSADVDNSYTFNGTFQHTIDAPLKIVWLKDGLHVSHCPNKMGCIDTKQQETSTSLKQLASGFYEFQLVVNKVTNKYIGHWSLEYFGAANEEYPDPLFRCLLTINVNTKTIKTYELFEQTTITTTLSTPSSSTVQTSTQPINNENEERLVLIVALGVISSVLVLVLTTFFLMFRCRVKIYARFTMRKKRSSQVNAHVYESIEDVHSSSQDASYRYSNSAVVLSNVSVTEKLHECYITVI